MPPRPTSIPTCFFFFPELSQQLSLGEWETGPRRRLGFTLSRARQPSPPTVGHLLITMCGPIVSAQEGIYGSLGFKWMFMRLVRQPKGRHYPKAFTATHVGSLLFFFLVLRYGVSRFTISISLHVFISKGWSITLKALRLKSLVFYTLCLFALQKPRNHTQFISHQSGQSHFTCVFFKKGRIRRRHLYSTSLFSYMLWVLASWLTSQQERKQHDPPQLCTNLHSALLHSHWTLLFALI